MRRIVEGIVLLAYIIRRERAASKNCRDAFGEQDLCERGLDSYTSATADADRGFKEADKGL